MIGSVSRFGRSVSRLHQCFFKVLLIPVRFFRRFAPYSSQIFQSNFSALRAVFQSNIPVRFFRIKKFPEPCFPMIFARRRRKFWKTGSSIRHFYCFLPCKKWNFVSNYNFLSEIQSFCSFPVIFSRASRQNSSHIPVTDFWRFAPNSSQISKSSQLNFKKKSSRDWIYSS